MRRRPHLCKQAGHGGRDRKGRNSRTARTQPTRRPLEDSAHVRHLRRRIGEWTRLAHTRNAQVGKSISKEETGASNAKSGRPVNRLTVQSSSILSPCRFTLHRILTKNNQVQLHGFDSYPENLSKL